MLISDFIFHLRDVFPLYVYTLANDLDVVKGGVKSRGPI